MVARGVNRVLFSYGIVNNICIVFNGNETHPYIIMRLFFFIIYLKPCKRYNNGNEMSNVVRNDAYASCVAWKLWHKPRQYVKREEVIYGSGNNMRKAYGVRRIYWRRWIMSASVMSACGESQYAWRRNIRMSRDKQRLAAQCLSVWRVCSSIMCKHEKLIWWHVYVYVACHQCAASSQYWHVWR